MKEIPITELKAIFSRKVMELNQKIQNRRVHEYESHTLISRKAHEYIVDTYGSTFRAARESKLVDVNFGIEGFLGPNETMRVKKKFCLESEDIQPY